MRATMTYDVVTEESAKDGDTSENGWALPGGWRFPLIDEDGYHEDVLEDVQANPDTYTVADTVADLMAIVESMGFYNEGSDWLTTGGEQDYQTGEYVTYRLHIEETTNATYGRIMALVAS